jgi:integrase
MFWADLEAHHPGIDSLHLSAEVADGWKQRMRTKPKTITTADGSKAVIDTERICHREFLTPVRAFYLDLAQWAVEDPGRWARWVAPCPVGPAETVQGKAQRHRKSRMDARTRERLPVLPVLVRCAARQHADAAALLQAARSASPGDVITAAGQTLARAATSSASASIWAEDLATGKHRNLTTDEDRAFWAWAAIEVLRATGMRAGQALGLRHCDFVSRRREVRIVPRADNANGARAKVRSAAVVPVSAPLVRLYSEYMHVEYGGIDSDYVFVNLFGGRVGAAMTYPAVHQLIGRIAARTGISFTAHVLRHSHATDMVRRGVPIEVVARLLTHRSSTTTSQVYVHLGAADIREALTRAGVWHEEEAR